MASKITERIEVLEECLKQLKAKQQRIEARKGSLQSRRARRDDTTARCWSASLGSRRVLPCV